LRGSVGVRSGGKLIQVSVTSVIDHQRISAHVLVRALTGVASPPIPTLPYWRFGTSRIYSSAYIHEWNTSDFPLIRVHNHHNLKYCIFSCVELFSGRGIMQEWLRACKSFPGCLTALDEVYHLHSCRVHIPICLSTTLLSH